MKTYYRPILRQDLIRPQGAISFAGTNSWIASAERLSRNAIPEIIPLSEVPDPTVSNWTKCRPSIAGLSFDVPIIMGILNVTPDSFSDGGVFENPEVAIAHARDMQNQGAGIIDIGGESTRPGAVEVQIEQEIARTAPVIAALINQVSVPISIDTRKSAVARAALEAGAKIVNDVSGLLFDPLISDLCAEASAPICIMHSQGTPDVMQDQPVYDDVLLDVYDFLDAQMATLIDAGVQRDVIITDPGIGFGKTLQHNLALLNRISLFHSLGAPVLLGASRKGMIKTISGAQSAIDRMPGSLAIALSALAQGVQIFRVHDVAETKQAFELHQAILRGEYYGT